MRFKVILRIIFLVFFLPVFSHGFFIQNSARCILHIINYNYDFLLKTKPGRVGIWHTARTENPPEQSKQLRDLVALPYLAGYKLAPKIKGVTIYEKKFAYDGLNLYASGHAPEALLMDMRGKILHKWNYNFKRVWPNYIPSEGYKNYRHFWRRVHLFENGDLLAIFERIGLIKIDNNSNLLWAYQGGCHHDLFITDNKLIYILTHKKKIIPRLNKHIPIEEDFVTILDQGGNEIKSFSLLKIMEKSSYASLIPRVDEIREGKTIDIFHTNTLEFFDGHLSKKSKIFKKGNILVSFRYLNTIAIIDLDAENIVWAFGQNELYHQHQPSLLENGNILVFDNGIKESRVLEIDPFIEKIVWQYKGDSKNEFFSSTCGSNQSLPNGNTLITESNSGRAFEVTPKKRIVWEYVSPHRAGKNNELVAALFEMLRVSSRLRFFKEK